MSIALFCALYAAILGTAYALWSVASLPRSVGRRDAALWLPVLLLMWAWVAFVLSAQIAGCGESRHVSQNQLLWQQEQEALDDADTCKSPCCLENVDGGPPVFPAACWSGEWPVPE